MRFSTTTKNYLIVLLDFFTIVTRFSVIPPFPFPPALYVPEHVYQIEHHLATQLFYFNGSTLVGIIVCVHMLNYIQLFLC